MKHNRFRFCIYLFIIILTIPCFWIFSCSDDDDEPTPTPTATPTATHTSTPNTQLAAYYPFDGNAHDESGYENHGVVHGATLTNDRFGNANRAYYFDGINDWINVAQDQFVHDDTLTVAFWMKIDAPSAYRYFMMCSDFGVGNEGNEIFIAISIPDTNSAHSSITVGEWVHIAGTYDGSLIRIYINGVKKGETYHPGSLGDPNYPLTFGFFNSHYWGKGSLDDVRIFDRVLPQSEIQVLANDI